MEGIVEGLIDLIFPPLCAFCGTPLAKDGKVEICQGCLRNIRFISPPICPTCGLPFPLEMGEDHLCGQCLQRQWHFGSARALGLYEGTMREAIHHLKYSGRSFLAKPLVELLERGYPFIDYGSYDILVPVPLHPKRLRERGFNQALLLGKAIGRREGVSCRGFVLKKARWSFPQISLSLKEREENVRGSFSVADPAAVRGKRILLIDDVMTTGSTVNECARELLKAGAGEVDVFTLARVV
ncbi:MAG: ComF family protein [Syntrophobacterales bacterium]|nr:MAG: ComF family protein [Syntrophobacterales bacterium]